MTVVSCRPTWLINVVNGNGAVKLNGLSACSLSIKSVLPYFVIEESAETTAASPAPAGEKAKRYDHLWQAPPILLSTTPVRMITLEPQLAQQVW
jgi:hypothetical protein